MGYVLNELGICVIIIDDGIIDIIYNNNDYDSIIKYMVDISVVEPVSYNTIYNFLELFGKYYFGNKYAVIDMNFDYKSKITGNQFNDAVLYSYIDMYEKTKRILRDKRIEFLINL
jgi:hypothetical protein